MRAHPFALGVVLLALAPGCGETSKATPEAISAGWTHEEPSQDLPEAVDEDGGQPAEVCDGLDNDGDGAVDEDQASESCTLSARRGTGTTSCVDGRTVCSACTPGETRTTACGCNQTRTDVCLQDGSWHLGTCDGCETVPTPCEVCVPGERIVKRCDECPDGGSCGANCIGSVWECVNGCKWEQKTNCQPMTPTCSGDMSIIESCGNCGKRVKSCDGCFWDSALCLEQGTCKPGTSLQTPCFGSGCKAGTYNTSYCTNECKWNTPSTCQGCVPGVTVQDVNCVPNRPLCGQRRVETTCTIAREVPICGGDQTLPMGQATLRNLTQCPPIQCYPGAGFTQTCTMSDGSPGTQQKSCKDDCTWQVSTCEPGGTTCPTGQSCAPSSVTTTRKSCGPNACGREYEETKTCTSTGCGYSVTTTQYTACPQCQVGQTKQLSCRTPSGQCGSLTINCNSSCTWDAAPAPGSTSSQCVASPSACVPGSTRTDYVSCGSNTCGRTYPRTMTCMSNGCGWQMTSEDRSVCPSCTPNQTETTTALCRPGVPSCGYIERKCNATTCDWQTLPCPACG